MSWSAWVVDLDVNRATGDIAVRRVVAGQGAGTPDADALQGLPAWQIEEAIARATGVRRIDARIARRNGFCDRRGHTCFARSDRRAQGAGIERHCALCIGR
ncbi:hypothetical protein BZM27_32805 [Paraburkholderia steynii]|uniref:Uncharacterized protein n=1 Tax=Paraburkholderia steynii TaxID=1245441 RepID=A0A4R0X5X0_9BURK|nr:hypothetical protein BZM27_32805 [Paraburkholderia steynii]